MFENGDLSPSGGKIRARINDSNAFAVLPLPNPKGPYCITKGSTEHVHRRTCKVLPEEMQGYAGEAAKRYWRRPASSVLRISAAVERCPLKHTQVFLRALQKRCCARQTRRWRSVGPRDEIAARLLET